jgi:hypothetical protein
VQQSARREAVAQPVEQLCRELELAIGHRGVVPLDAVHVVDGDEGRLAADREAHVVVGELPVDLVGERVDRTPLLVREGTRDARVLVDARDLHLEGEDALRDVGHAGDRRGAGGKCRAGERDVAFSRRASPRSRRARSIPRPARTLRPMREVGEVLVRPARPVERLLVRGELDEIAGYEARRDAQPAQDLHQQPRRIAARADGAGEGLLRRLDAGLHAHRVVHLVAHHGVDGGEEVDGADRRAEEALARAVHPVGELRCLGDELQVGCELAEILVAVDERELLALGSTKKSNGLMTVMSRTMSTTNSSSRDFSGNTTRATQLP